MTFCLVKLKITSCKNRMKNESEIKQCLIVRLEISLFQQRHSKISRF